MILIYAYLKIPIEKQAVIYENASKYALCVKAEEGNIDFEVATNNKGEFFFWEKFADMKAFEEHKKQEHFVNWRSSYEPFVIERKLEALEQVV